MNSLKALLPPPPDLLGLGSVSLCLTLCTHFRQSWPPSPRQLEKKGNILHAWSADTVWRTQRKQNPAQRDRPPGSEPSAISPLQQEEDSRCASRLRLQKKKVNFDQETIQEENTWGGFWCINFHIRSSTAHGSNNPHISSGSGGQWGWISRSCKHEQKVCDGKTEDRKNAKKPVTSFRSQSDLPLV